MNGQLIAMAALAVAVIALVISLVNAKNLIKWRNIYRRSMKDSERPVEQALIEEWQKAFESLPEHSPKWKAYQKRLIDVGVIKRGN